LVFKTVVEFDIELPKEQNNAFTLMLQRKCHHFDLQLIISFFKYYSKMIR